MNDFDDNFGGPADAYNDPYLIDSTLDPYIFVTLGMLALLVVVVCLVGYYIGRSATRRRLEAERKASRDAIYGSVRYALEKAMKSSGAVILERGREVADILDARLGLLVVVHNKLGKAVATLRNAPSAKRPEPPKPAGQKVPRGTYSHAFEVSQALEDLSAFWQKDTVDELLRNAQRELSTPPVMPVVQNASMFKWERKTPSAAAVVKGALEDANKAGTAPVAPLPGEALPAKTEDAAPAPEPDPTPPPPPPAPKPKRGGPLPAHKRNMLA
ncbi:hypothetical protein ABI_46090 [Asticcacaulis biprosthecium C19]|uniref:Uncharacterized protein n=1 Tax=Asticcacaulis biprosthecium C19 TaxID=715226 RepID=F4QTW1_9CAUL|nr:hypothetical protein [Asticcacaulis biprosthecium]EGF89261.1 hypothetical protein ABI_46090 [Asticcacaulis biprosthecium C19]